ncbi:hypothetical protein WJX82_009854 [Trebouxia sp. C0006]
MAAETHLIWDQESLSRKGREREPARYNLVRYRSSSTTLHINSIRSIESDCIRDSSSQGQMNLDCSAQSDVTLSHVIHAAPRLLENTANKPSQRLLL